MSMAGDEYKDRVAAENRIIELEADLVEAQMDWALEVIEHEACKINLLNREKELAESIERTSRGTISE